MTDKDIAELKAHCTMAGRGTLADWMSPYVLPLIAAIERLTGAMKADDERLRIHGERVGLFMDCDTAEHMADEILALRAQLAQSVRWIPVGESVPQVREAYPRKIVIALLENGAHVEAMYGDGAWFEWDGELNDWIPLTGVTHWFRVPQAPGQLA